MVVKAFLPVHAAVLVLGLAVPASAQVAAETATILSGTGQATGSASRSMGSAVSGSLNNAADAIRATRNGGASRGRSGGGGAQGGFEIPTSGDILEGTDAPTYRLGNGASIRVSGALRQTAEAACSQNCPQDKPAPAPAP